MSAHPHMPVMGNGRSRHVALNECDHPIRGSKFQHEVICRS